MVDKKNWNKLSKGEKVDDEVSQELSDFDKAKRENAFIRETIRLLNEGSVKELEKLCKDWTPDGEDC